MLVNSLAEKFSTLLLVGFRSGEISAARLHRPPLSGYTDSRSALRAESRIYGDTELRIYGKKECDAGGKMARIGLWKRMKFGNEVPEGFVVVEFVDFLHDSANFKQAWFALAALEVL